MIPSSAKRVNSKVTNGQKLNHILHAN